MSDYDVVIVGGGPGGYVAAIRASQLGLKIALVERESLGGVCLNWGCIPTKALLRTSEIYRMIKGAQEFGISVSGVSFDIEKIVERSRMVANKLSGGIDLLMRKNKVKVFSGNAEIISANEVLIDEKTKLTTEKVIIATGAKARIVPSLPIDNNLIWDYKKAMIPDIVPKKLIVVGSGAIGMEFASFYRDLGCEVTVVELLNRVLPSEDEEVSNFVKDSFEKRGIKIMISTTVEGSKLLKKSVELAIKDSDGKSSKISADRVISAVGIVGNTEGLDHLDIKIEKNHIITNEWGETNKKGIYAIGDVVGGPWLAHKASHEGILCIEKIASEKKIPGVDLDSLHPMNTENIPACTYCHPQVASVGMTEKQAQKHAKENGYEIKVGRFSAAGNGKAVAMGDDEGFVKVIFKKETGELLGAHMVASEVTEMIQGYVIGKQSELTDLDFKNTIFPHPTMSEMMHEAVLAARKEAIHS